MAYLGRNPAVGTQRTLDSIESQFNGVLTTFNLRYSGQPTYPTLSASLIVSLGGVLQEPGEAYYVSSDTIVFSEAPQTGTECWILLYSEYGAGIGAAEQGNIGAANVTLTGELRGPSNFVIDPAAVGNNTGTVEIKGNLTVQGTTTTINSTTVDLDHIALGDNELANFGDGNDLRIYHDGSNSYIDNTTANTLFIRNASTGNIDVRTSTTSRAFVAYNAGQVELFYADSKKLETTNTGVSVTGSGIFSGSVGVGSTSPNSRIALGVNSSYADTIRSYSTEGAGLEFYDVQSQGAGQRFLDIYSIGAQVAGYGGGAIRFVTNPQGSNTGLTRLFIDQAGNVGVGTTSMYTSGGTQRLCIASANILSAGPSASDMFYIRNQGVAGDFAWQTVVSGSNLGSIQLQPYGGNVGIGTTNPETKLDIRGPLKVQDPSNSPIDAFNIRKPGDAARHWMLFQQGTSYYRFGMGASPYNLELWYGLNSTASSPGSQILSITTSGNVGIGTTNPTEKLVVAGSVNINTGYLKMTGVATPNHENYIQMTGNGTSYIGVGAEANPTIKFKVGSTSTTILDISSTEVTPGTDATYNLGSPTKRWANIYSGDLQLSNEGSATGNEVDGTWGAYTIQEGEENLYLINRRSGKKFKFILEEVK